MGYLLEQNFTQTPDKPPGNCQCVCVVRNAKTTTTQYGIREFFSGQWVIEDDYEEVIAWAYLDPHIALKLSNVYDNESSSL